MCRHYGIILRIRDEQNRREEASAKMEIWKMGPKKSLAGFHREEVILVVEDSDPKEDSGSEEVDSWGS